MAREKLIWAIDCDDVIVPTAQVIADAYNDRYGTSLTLGNFYSHDDEGAWGVVSAQEAITRVSKLLRSGVAADAIPSQETIEALMELASKDELHMVTGRQSFLEGVTHHMLETYLPGVFRTVEHTNYFVEDGSDSTSRTKGEVCAAIGADVLIDDHIAHGVSVLESGLEEVIIWGEYPWNRSQKLGRGMVRCVVWEEVFRERERILANR